jgi:hypothetical protein
LSAQVGWLAGIRDDAGDPVVAAGSEGVQVGHRRRQRLERYGAVQEAVRPVLVVMSLVGGQYPAQTGRVPYQGAVEKFPAASADAPLHARVHAGHPDTASHDPHPRGHEHRVEVPGLLDD